MVLHRARRQRAAAHTRITGLLAEPSPTTTVAASHHHQRITVRAVQRLDLSTAQQTTLLHHHLCGRIASHLKAVLLLEATRLLQSLLDLLRALNHNVVQAMRVTGRCLLRG